MPLPYKVISGSSPLLVHIPHSSTVIHPDIRHTLLLNDEELQLELLRMTDWYTDELCIQAEEMDGTHIINRYSRLVVDPERFPNDANEVMAGVGMGAVYTRTSDG